MVWCSATAWSIDTDEPVFVSPYCPQTGHCEHCGRAYAPQSFAAGEVTEANHRCKRAGGIYLYYGADPQLVTDVTADTGFAAVVEPVGQVLDYSEKAAVGIGRTQAVLVTAIYAVCSVTNPPHPRMPLPEGQLVPKGVLQPRRADLRASPSAGVLMPICYGAAHADVAASAVYHFQGEEGRLTYQPSQLWRS